MLDAYTYVFAIGTMFALLEAFNNGASTSPSFPFPWRGLLRSARRGVACV